MEIMDAELYAVYRALEHLKKLKTRRETGLYLYR